MALLQINGVDMPEPSSMKILTQDLHADTSTRTETGKMIINRIRAEVYKVECAWTGLPEIELKKIKDAVRPVTVNLTFRDSDGIVKTKEFYTGDKGSDPVKLFDSDKRWSYAFNFIEV